MHSPPLVSYPVGYSCMADRLVMAGWLAGVVCTGLAASGLVMHDIAGWRAWMPCVVALLAGLLAWQSRHGSVGDRLAFDAGLWSEISVTGVTRATGPTRVCLDMQRLMLIRLDANHGDVRWYWVDRNADPANWLDLRRTLFASGRPAVDAAPREGRRAFSA